ncbi:MAG: peptidoglycan DD-metalloendopeptidase family protein [Thiotrichales bacterium]|nr:peptidoglycan DD-metalloendopeptidase family protein [Thiotrichales bacterium]
MIMNGFMTQSNIGRALKRGMEVIFVIMLMLVVSGCSNHSVKRSYLEPSTDLEPIKNSASDHLNKNASEKSLKQSSKQACSNSYKVVSGDSLSLISAKCNIKLSALAKANNLKKPYLIRIGQRLTIPTLTASTVRQAGSISKTPVHRLPSSTEVRKSYQLANWQWPMEQRLEHRFIRDGAGITGLEINAFPGMAVMAVADGEVVYVGSGIMQFGLMVMLKHASGHMSVYAHNSQVFVKEGQVVKVGQKIANSGATGLTDRPKVYVEARYKGKKVDIKKLFD